MHDVSIVIVCHADREWDGLVRAVASAQAQQPSPTEVVVVVDHNERLFAKAQRELTGVTVLRNAYARGASGNRNTGAWHTTTPLIAFLDGDAVAHPGWLAGLIAPLHDDGVIGTGGSIRPVWSRRPLWVPDEFLWAYGGSYPGQPTQPAPVRNVWSASMAVRRDAFAAVGGFRVGFGKVGRRSRPEDTELCLRMAQASGGTWRYIPSAVIDHPVTAEHTGLGYFLRRCFHEGRGKVELARLEPERDQLGTERAYLRSLPAAMWRYLTGAASKPADSRLADSTTVGAGMARAGAMTAGIAVAGAGAALEYVRPRR